MDCEELVPVLEQGQADKQNDPQLGAGIKYMKEPECWVGHGSIMADPLPFRDVPEDHFALDTASAKELQKLYDTKQQPDMMGVPPPSQFHIKGGSTAFEEKQARLGRAIDENICRIYSQPGELRSQVEELWKLNNIMVYDLSNIDYTNEDGIRALQDANLRAKALNSSLNSQLPQETLNSQTSTETGGFKPMDVEDDKQDILGKASAAYRPQFISKRMQTEAPKQQHSATTEAPRRNVVAGGVKTVGGKKLNYTEEESDEEKAV